jgi:four helix bundle protein
MKYERFEDLPVWKSALDLTVHIFLMMEDKSLNYRGDLRNQLQRAALSISNNIAEGFERGTTQELLTYLYIARGSAGEVRNMLIVMERLPFFDHLKSEISNLKSLAESISRQLRGWADSLQNSEVTGQRYLNEKTKRVTDQKRQADEFMARLKQMQEEQMQKRLAQRGQSPPT